MARLGQGIFTKAISELSFIKMNRNSGSKVGPVKDSQQIIELPVLCIIKSEKKTVDITCLLICLIIEH